MRGARHLAAVVLSTSLLLGTSAVVVMPRAAAQESVASASAVIAVDALNIRATPGLSTPIVTTLGYGTVITITGASVDVDGYAWYPIELSNGTSGWSVAGFILGTTPPNGPVTPGTPATPTGGFLYGDPVMVSTDLLNVRSSPSINASVLTVYGYGTTATITGDPTVADNITWYPIDNYGWVSGAYLWLNACGCRDGVYPPEDDGGTSGAGGDGSGVSFAYNAYVHVRTDALNVRSAPSLSASVVTVYTSGTLSVITGGPTVADGYTWYAVDNLGWVAGDYLSIYETLQKTINVDVANVRSSPSTSGAIVSTLFYGTVVDVYDFGGDANAQWIAINPARTQWVLVGLTV